MTAIQSRAGSQASPSVPAILDTGSPVGGETSPLPDGVSEPTMADLHDVLSAMYALLLADEAGDEQQGASRVQSDQAQRQFALQRQMQEIQREARDTGGHGFFACLGKLLGDVTGDVTRLRFGKLAGDALSDLSACDNPKFWSDLEVGAKIVSAIAAAAATVCTAGAAGPLVVGVAVALSAAGWAVQQTRCLGGASAWVGGGLALGAGVVSCGGTLLASSTAAAASLAQTTNGAVNTASLLRTAGAVANTTSAGATMVSGAAHLEVARYQADAIEAEAGAKAADQLASFFALMQEWAMASLADQVRSHRDAMVALTEAIQTNQRSSLIAAGVLSRG